MLTAGYSPQADCNWWCYRLWITDEEVRSVSFTNWENGVICHVLRRST